MLRKIEWGVQNGPFTKNRVLPVTKYFPFSKILFQFRNLVYRVDLMYQPSKCPYSYFSKALEFYFRVFFFPVSILKIDLNGAEIRTVQDYVCTTPSIETHLVMVWGPPTKKFLPKCVNEKSSTEHHS